MIKKQKPFTFVFFIMSQYLQKVNFTKKIKRALKMHNFKQLHEYILNLKIKIKKGRDNNADWSNADNRNPDPNYK